ncbi:MAG: AAA family ATPase [Candidatus Bathyarchaeia archaeon]
MPNIICLLGPDGSGKTTLARELAKNFSAMGFKVKVSWMRGTHTLASLIARFISNFSIFRGSQNIYYGIIIPKGLVKMWHFLEFVSVMPIFLIKFLFPSLLGYIVVGERGLLDFIIWVSMTTDSPNFVGSFLGRATLAIALKYSFNIYIKADLIVLASRKRDSSKTLRLQLSLYDPLAKSLGIFTVDTTNKTPKNSLTEILYNIACRT